MIVELDKKLIRSLQRLGFRDEELNRTYLLFSSLPPALAALILDQARKSQAPRMPKN